jgi:hypothetical protein
MKLGRTIKHSQFNNGILVYSLWKFLAKTDFKYFLGVFTGKGFYHGKTIRLFCSMAQGQDNELARFVSTRRQ